MSHLHHHQVLSMWLMKLQDGIHSDMIQLCIMLVFSILDFEYLRKTGKGVRWLNMHSCKP